MASFPRAQVSDACRQMGRELEDILADSKRAELRRNGLTIVIAGPPNAGKSTLFNALLRRDAAIVSPYAGTTRDPIEGGLTFEGHLAILIDTAGLRDSDDPVEAIGIARARERAEKADIVLWAQAVDSDPVLPPGGLDCVVLPVRTKTDLAQLQGDGLAVCAVTGGRNRHAAGGDRQDYYCAGGRKTARLCEYRAAARPRPTGRGRARACGARAAGGTDRGGAASGSGRACGADGPDSARRYSCRHFRPVLYWEVMFHVKHMR